MLGVVHRRNVSSRLIFPQLKVGNFAQSMPSFLRFRYNVAWSRQGAATGRQRGSHQGCQRVSELGVVV